MGARTNGGDIRTPITNLKILYIHQMPVRFKSDTKFVTFCHSLNDMSRCQD